MIRFAVPFASLVLVTSALAADEVRTFTFRYSTTVGPIEAGAGPVQCACHDALRLALWSDKRAVRREVVERLKPIIGRYFEQSGVSGS